MQQYSILNLAKHALSGHMRWSRTFGGRKLRKRYDVIIVGGGGHGLATAYYLAKNYGITNVAVLEKGWLGGGNTGRNTTMVRSDYLLPANADFKEFSLQLWEELSQKLNYNVMLSQRGYVSLACSDAEMEAKTQQANALRLRGIDCNILNIDELKKVCPELDVRQNTRYPIQGALYQARGGIARHDAVAWGYARGAHNKGIDIFENCGVEDFIINNNRVSGVKTAKGDIMADTVVVSVAGSSGLMAAKAGFTLPIETLSAQAFVSESLKPIINQVVSFDTGYAFINQSDKGELVMGGHMEPHNGYHQRGGFDRIENTLSTLVTLFPFLSRVRIMRTWGGMVDNSMDGAPILGDTPVERLLFNSGWGYTGFKATPASGWTMAHHIATGEPHDLSEPFKLSRFRDGSLVDEHGTGPYPTAY
ncbi:MAG: sarcosine oxidase subunit beta family protein [Rhodospirillales bacterium]|jgi:heterotetrameric sarcosine oxidase beta subunit|nr:sarcosine oxidase subunit beta family protein [Rhodospirillales bacterium]